MNTVPTITTDPDLLSEVTTEELEEARQFCHDEGGRAVCVDRFYALAAAAIEAEIERRERLRDFESTFESDTAAGGSTFIPEHPIVYAIWAGIVVWWFALIGFPP